MSRGVMKALDAGNELDLELLLSAALTAKLEQTSFLDDEPVSGEDVGETGIYAFLAQYFSSSLGFRMVEFAVPLLLITYFSDTLLPNAIYGFTSCVTNILLAQWLGSLVDRLPKLTLVRYCIIVQRLSSIVLCGACASLFVWRNMCDRNGVVRPQSITMPAFRLILLGGAALQSANTCLGIAIQQDWVTCLSCGSSDRLSVLNARVKRVDLSCRLLGPLIVSLLSAYLPHLWAAVALGCIALIMMLFDIIWVGYVYRLCPPLAREQAIKEERQQNRMITMNALEDLGLPTSRTKSSWDRLERIARVWTEFANLPTFLSSVTASLIAMNVLSLDGPMLSFLKTQGYSVTIVSAMRLVYVLTGFGGTLLAPILERRISSVRGGTWSLWPAILFMTPAIVSLHFIWKLNQAAALIIVFFGISISNFGLWCFELIQVKQLQMAIEDHPERNSLASLQYTMYHTSDLMKYALTMFFFSKPSDFKWTALISFVSVIVGAIAYSGYAKRARGTYLS